MSWPSWKPSLTRPSGDATLEASERIQVEGVNAFGDASRVSSASLGPADAGAVTLRAPRIVLRAGGTITTNAEAADGGNVTIRAKEFVRLDAGEITASVNGGPETTGGNITIDPEVVLLENGSKIIATAAGGHGGRIDITTDNYFAFPGSEVSAEADRQDLSGIVEVHAPDVDLAGKIVALPTTFLDAGSLMRERCAARRSGERAGSFAVRGNGGIPPEPEEWLPASVTLRRRRDRSRSPGQPSPPEVRRGRSIVVAADNLGRTRRAAAACARGDRGAARRDARLEFGRREGRN